MLKITNKVIAAVLAVIMAFSTSIVALAGMPQATLDLLDGDYYAGTNITVHATVTGLTAEAANANSNFTWSMTSANNNYTSNVSSLENFKSSEQADGTYTVTESASVSLPMNESGLETLTINAVFGGITCTKTVTEKQPITSISIIETDECTASYYNDKTSALYIDEYKNDGDRLNKFAVLSVVTSPAPNDDSTSAVSDNAGNASGDVCVSCAPVPESTCNEYKIDIASRSDQSSTIKFVPKSGYKSSKIISVYKCIPLDEFVLSYKGNPVAGTDGQVSTAITVFKGESADIDVNYFKPSASNDDIKYTMYHDEACTVKCNNALIEKNGRGCTISCDDNTATHYLKAEAISKDNSGLARNLSCVFPITFREYKGIDSIYFGDNESVEPTYELGTVTNNILELSELLTYAPLDHTDEIVYSTNNETVAKVNDKTGTVTAISGGSAIITAQAILSGKSAKCTINVTPQISELSLSAEKKSLPLGHSEKITAIYSPSDVIDTISWSTNNPDAITIVEKGSDYAYITANPNYQLSSASETVKIFATTSGNITNSIEISIENAKRADSITLTPEKVGNAALQTIDAANNTYCMYSGDTISINCNTVSNNGICNDVIEWRVAVGNGSSITLDEAQNYNYLTYTRTANDIQVTTKVAEIMKFTAYAILSGQDISQADIQQTITIQNNTKTKSIILSPSGKKIIPTNSSFNVSVTLTENVITNKDKVVFESTNPQVATVTYDDNTKTATITSLNQLGTADIICYACYDVNDYKNTAAKTNKITVQVTNDIQNADVNGIYDVEYKGGAYTLNDFPGLNVSYQGISLNKDKDYRIAFSTSSRDNTNVGTKSITLTGVNPSYAGTKTVYFNIVQRNIGGVTATIKDQTFKGTPLEPAVTVYDYGINKSLARNKDYTVAYVNNYNVGTATVYIYGIGNYTGVATATFNINPASIASAKVSAVPRYTENGYPICPDVYATCFNAQLYNGVDYVLSYANNVAPGKATITITGIGNYTGTKTVYFYIDKTPTPPAPPAPIPASKLKVTLSTTSYTYNGKTKKPSVTVKDSNGRVISSSNYTVSYAKGRKYVGKYAVKVTFKGNYSGTKTVYFTIKPKSTSISSLKTGKKKFTVKWKKQTSQTSGYQIQYSTSSKFKSPKYVTVSGNKKTSKSVSKLKAKKKYYVRVRTYKTVKVNGKSTKIYSSWSKTKAVTTKR